MEKRPTLNGLRPTSRQGAIFGLYVCLFLVVDGVIVASHRVIGGVNVLPLIFMFCLWLLGLLIVLLDRPGPVRNWAGPFLVSLSCPYVALWYDGEAILHWARSAPLPPWHHIVLINGLLLGGFGVYFVRMYPRSCPSCGLRSLIPLLRLTRVEKRLSRTRWCASCGETLWKDAEGRWQKERRRTWVEASLARNCASPEHSN
ncbi:MAG: hypothetical protein P4L84_12375 [Isosphaeraceae bacterium]|nr:hypothetical protein [Isosphaeraceae bacterium]